MKSILYRITTDYACFGIIAQDDRIIKAAPIAGWTIGKRVYHALKYYIENKKAKIERID